MKENVIIRNERKEDWEQDKPSIIFMYRDV